MAESSGKVNHVTMKTGVVNNGPNNSVNDKQQSAEIKKLRAEFNDLSKIFKAYACCQQPFEQALQDNLALVFEENELKKRP